MLGPKSKPEPEPVRYTIADNEARARLEALRWKDADPVDLARALKQEAQRLYAPAGTTVFPSRHEFNNLVGMVVALCDTVNPPEEAPGA